MDSIATYSETRLTGKRQFELYPDSIRVRGRVFAKSDFDATIPLKSLQPDCHRLRIRNSNFSAGLWIILISALLVGILLAGFKLPVNHALVVLVAVQPIAGVCLCLATFRKVEFSRFQNDAGVTLLDVARAGKDKDRFDNFVETLATAIRTSRETVESARLDEVTGKP